MLSGAERSNLPCVWFVNRKLLHQRVEGKEVSQEENFLPKHQRVKDLCQRAEYQTPCQQTGQVRWCTPSASSSTLTNFQMFQKTQQRFFLPGVSAEHKKKHLLFFFFGNKRRKSAPTAAVITNREQRETSVAEMKTRCHLCKPDRYNNSSNY